MATAAGLAVIGDVVCQMLENAAGDEAESKSIFETFDYARLFATTTFSTFYVGSFLHVLFRTYPHVIHALGTAVPRLSALRNLGGRAHPMACAVLDNIHIGLIYTPAYFLGIGLLSGQGKEVAVSTLREEWWSGYSYGTLFWLPFMWYVLSPLCLLLCCSAHARARFRFNFAQVPLKHRVKAAAGANLAWNVVIDYIAHREHEPAPESSEKLVD
jgi:hypothetical protein